MQPARGNPLAPDEAHLGFVWKTLAALQQQATAAVGVRGEQPGVGVEDRLARLARDDPASHGLGDAGDRKAHLGENRRLVRNAVQEQDEDLLLADALLAGTRNGGEDRRPSGGEGKLARAPKLAAGEGAYGRIQREGASYAARQLMLEVVHPALRVQPPTLARRVATYTEGGGRPRVAERHHGFGENRRCLADVLGGALG